MHFETIAREPIHAALPPLLSLALVSTPALRRRHLPGAQPLARPPQERFVARDTVWRCADDGLRLDQRTATRPAIVCAALARQVGALRSFTVDGRAFGAEELAEPATRARAAERPRTFWLLPGGAAPHFGAVLRQYELVEKVRGYDPDADEAMINRAYVFSMKAHGSQTRASGDPYYSHPIEVAGILTDLHLDDETIVTAILHDTIEDTLATPAEIKKLFGKNVARLVDGVTKLSKIEAQSESQRAAENLRKFLLAMSDDIRVLLVKLADRLHNMRTLHHLKDPEKRRRIARETMDIYAPLAERIGMYEFMTEMQTLAFRELEPDAYESITKRLERLHEGGGGDLIQRIGRGIKAHLEANGIEAEVQGREKHPYSIWRKMAERHVSFEQLSDVMAFRAVVGSVEECYRTLGLIHQRWPVVPGPLQGLHLDAQAQRLPLDPHHDHP